MSHHILLCLGLFIGILVLFFVGTRVRAAQPSSGHPESASIINNAVLALLGLLIAFSFSNAYFRLDARRQLITAEVNATDTALLRTDLIPASVQPKMRDLIESYVAARVAYYKEVDTTDEIKSTMDSLQTSQREIWALALASTQGPSGDTPRRLLLPALNEMFDIATTRVIALETHLPPIIIVMLVVLTLVCAFLIGYQAPAHGSVLYAVIFAFTITFVLYVIMDIEHPRKGWVRLDSANAHLSDLLTSIRSRRPE